MAEVLGVVAAAIQLSELAFKICQALQAFRGYRGKMRDYKEQLTELTVISKEIQTNPLLHTDEVQTAVRAILNILAEDRIQVLLVKKHPIQQAINCILLPKAWENLSGSIEERKSTLSLCILQAQSKALHQILISQNPVEKNPASPTMSHVPEDNESVTTFTRESSYSSESASSYAESNTTVSDNEEADLAEDNEKSAIMDTRSASFTRNRHHGQRGARVMNPPGIAVQGSQRDQWSQGTTSLFQGQVHKGYGDMIVGAYVSNETRTAPLTEVMRGSKWSNNQKGTEDQMGPGAPQGNMMVGVEFARHMVPEAIAGTWKNNYMYHNGDMFVGIRL